MTNPILQEDLERIHNVVGRRERFDGATVIVTGCAGFLGFYIMQYLVRYSRALGIKKILGLDTFLLGRPDWLTALAQQASDVLDLRAFDIARDHIADVEGAKDVRFVIHGASIASPTYYRQYPLETIDANIWGLRSLFDFYRGSKTLEGFLYFSSSEIYGDPEPSAIPTDENYRGNVSCVGPRACYDESKRFGETMCYVFAKHHGLPATVVRPFNNYGPGMRIDDRRLPADFAQCVLGNKDIVILSDGAPTRTFCYVSDAVAGYLLALLHGKFDSFNIGIEGPEIAVFKLAEIYCSAGKEIFDYAGNAQFKKSVDPEYMTDNPNRRCPTIKKAREILGYNPQILVEEGVRRYLRFLQAEGATA